MLQNTNLKGIVGAALTPVTEDYEVDVAALKKHCDALLDEGCEYVSVFGTTGEGASFSSQQKVDALRSLAHLGMNMSKHIPAVISSSVDEAALLYKAISELGCRAALIIPPFYYQASQAGVVDFYRAVVKKSGGIRLEVVLYNFPFFSGVKFTPSLVQAVIDALGDRVIGIKDSTGNLEEGMTLIQSFPQLSIFTGDDRILRRMVQAGGAGMIGGMTNLFAKDAVAMYAGQHDPSIDQMAAQRIEAVDSNGGLIALKALLSDRYGLPSFNRLMPPLLRLDSDIASALKIELHL